MRKRLNKKNSDLMKGVKASNNIFYIIELNEFTESEIKKVFNNVLRMKRDKARGDFF